MAKGVLEGIQHITCVKNKNKKNEGNAPVLLVPNRVMLLTILSEYECR